MNAATPSSFDPAQIGISGFASYLPRHRVSLEDWCRWTGDSWDKIRSVVGDSFRMRGLNENAYTMAATAVLRLIRAYDIDPARIGFLGLGTESSTDNSAGAVIVKGMVNRGLKHHGLAPVARACEVPEFKHACLGGVYALKAAARYLALDGRDRVAIVVCADVAEYAPATSGEPTQGAGAVAMLIEPNARLLTLELQQSGSASDYRGPDFRKPFLRFMEQTPNALAQPRDFPIFNGKYSTTCYIDEVLAAMRDLFDRVSERPAVFLRRQCATFLHRPYQRMAETGLVISYLLALALGNEDDLTELASYADEAGIEVQALIAELTGETDVYALVESENLGTELYPLASAAARAFRQSARFAEMMTRLGDSAIKNVGNLYTASLPAWMAAGIEEAANARLPLAGSQILTVGYGSGDAAEVIPMRFVEGWEQAADRIAFAESLGTGETISEADYRALHQGSAEGLSDGAGDTFYIDRIGARTEHFDDSGIEYYRYQP
ncbi:MAG: hydroxymethylglutaryl-CoA synthase [Pseudomonadota bacterium]